MKKGMILYITQGQEDVPLQEVADLVEISRSMGISAVSVATSGEDVVHGWRRLIDRGIQQVLFMTVTYDTCLDRFLSRSAPVRLCG